MIRVAIDAGGTNLRVKIGDELEPLETMTVHSSDYDGFLDKIFGAIGRHTYEERVEGIAISVAGSHDGQAITACSNLQGWIGRPIVKDLQKRYDCPVYLIRDIQAMGASEYAARQHPFILATWDSGVNFGVVLGDDIFSPVMTGPSIIGEGGHQIIVPGGRQCPCGQQGCLEAYTGGIAMEQLYGDPVRRSGEAWQTIVTYMAQGLQNVIALTGGKLPIYMSGSVACKQAQHLPALRMALRSIIKSVPVPRVEIARYREDAGLNGAARILERQLRTGRF